MAEWQTEENVLSRFKNAKIDGAAFTQCLSTCELKTCLGMCCYDGVYVEAEEEEFLRNIANRRRKAFGALGVNLPEDVVVDGFWPGMQKARKTAVRPFPFSRSVGGYPAHFADTSCVFRAEGGQCGLQLLATSDDVEPWSYKPTPCWLHPISVTAAQITLFNTATDRFSRGSYSGYASRTFCGKICDGGDVAYKVLEPELQRLGRHLGRDLLSEIAAQLNERMA
jgi:hypothetical protein